LSVEAESEAPGKETAAEAYTAAIDGATAAK